MKGPILDWISAEEPLVPALHRRDKRDRGYNHNRTGALLCPAGLDWNDPEYVIPLATSFSLEVAISILGFKKSLKAENYRFEGTNGLPFYTPRMTLIILGAGFCEALCLSL